MRTSAQQRLIVTSIGIVALASSAIVLNAATPGGPVPHSSAQPTSLSSKAATSMNDGAWSTVESQAVTALTSYGAGPSNVGTLSGEFDSSFTSEAGETIPVAERTLTASIHGIPSQIVLSWLNQIQMIVSFTTFGAQFQTTSLVLKPNSSNIADAYTSPSEGVTAPTSDGGATGTLAAQVLQRQTARETPRLSAPPMKAQLDSFLYEGGCEEYIDPPSTELSIYGVLVYGIAGYVNNSCNGNQSLFVALAFGATQLNDANGAAGNPSDVGVGAAAYWPCYYTPGNLYIWYTNALYNVFGTYYGYSDGYFLNCSDS